jgi:hypothetical protein
MKRLLVTVALVLIAVPSFGAIQYEFTIKNTSDDGVAPSHDLNARAIVDGGLSRVEFLSGNLYPPGTYVISNDASGRLYFVDPAKQWFTEVNTGGITSALGAASIKIQNLKSNLESLPDRRVIAGIDADHFRLLISYDITVTMKTIPITQHVETEIDTWSTLKFGTVHQSFLSSGVRTGNEAIDKLLETQNKVAGFPLRQLVTIRTKYDLPANTKIQRPSTRTLTRETWVTKIKETTAIASQFVVPASYRRADQPELPKSAAQVLTFDPPPGTK